MSWVTTIWAMVGAACLTLAVVHGFVWRGRRKRIANALFALSVLGTALFASIEFWIMHAETPDEFGRAVRWLHVPAWLIVVSLVGFIRTYLRAGRPWLAWTVFCVRTLSLLLDFTFSPNLNYRVITGVRRVPFLGEPISIAVGVPNPWMLVGQLSLVLWALFALDAALTVWRRGDHQRAVLVGGSIIFFSVVGTCQTLLVFWGVVDMPLTSSWFFMGIILAMSYELSSDVNRASDLGRQLQVSEEKLKVSHRETETLSGRLISAHEDERTRLAGEMHDGLNQNLALLAVELDTLGQQPRAPEDLTFRLNGFASQVKAMSADVRRMSHGLHPAKLEQLGLAAAMTGHCRDVERAHPIVVSCKCLGVPRWLPPEMSLCLYRVTQEALQNVVKHSGARAVSVELTGVDGELFLSVLDDGKGFDLQAARASAGLGLRSMLERVRLIHGQIRWQSRPGAGTRVEVTVPLPHPGASA
jgi:signal transduction histidine kinase